MREPASHNVLLRMVTCIASDIANAARRGRARGISTLVRSQGARFLVLRAIAYNCAHPRRIYVGLAWIASKAGAFR